MVVPSIYGTKLMIHLHGHSAFITGSTQGIGKAIACAFAQAGANVLVHGERNAQEDQQVVAECKGFGVQSQLLTADLANIGEKELCSLCETCFSLMPKLDILVNNAGSFFDLPYLKMSQERFDRTMNLHVRTPYFLTQAFARHWIASRTPGRVLFVGSLNGRFAEVDSTAYDTSKGAVEMMVKTIAVASISNGIRVNGIAPGLIRTPLTAWIDRDPKASSWMEYHTPNGQIPDAEVCGPAAVYLCSDMSDHVVGHMLTVDGGMSAWQQPPAPLSE
jgi:glucose 1-dehydrogenase